MYTPERLAVLTAFAEDARRSADLRADLAVTLQRRAALARGQAEEAVARQRARRDRTLSGNDAAPPASAGGA